jgi:hypothetical protein
MKFDGKIADTEIGDYTGQSLLGLTGAVFWKEERSGRFVTRATPQR